MRSDRFCCSRHWQSIPSSVRERLSEAFYDFRSEIITVAVLQRVEGECLAELGWNLVTADDRKLGQFRCRKCGKSCLFAWTQTGGRIALDEVRNAAERVKNEYKLLCVVGFVAVIADPHPQSFARFIPHTCVVAAAATEEAA